MPALALSRTADLKHHVEQGAAWLDKCDQGANTAALSYAAFEFRLAIERLVVHYWAQLLGRRPEEKDLRDIRSFKRIERRIYELAGHQGEINVHFEFMRVVAGLLAIETRLETPNLGQLSRHWHECSELCHIGWTLACSVPQLCADAFDTLQEIRDSLTEQVNGLASWPSVQDSAFADLRDRFVVGNAGSEDVRAYLQTTGAWARVEYNDGRPSEFLGEAIAPSDGSQSR